MSHIITVRCQNPTCGKVQKMELRKVKFERGIPMLDKKSKICVMCERRFKVNGNSVVKV